MVRYKCKEEMARNATQEKEIKTMMRNTITRTIETSRIYFSAVTVENGNVVAVQQPSVELVGKYTTKDADKWLKKNRSYLTCVVTDIEVTEQLYEISVKDFMKYATPVQK